MSIIKIVLGAVAILLGLLYICWSRWFCRLHPAGRAGETAGNAVKWIIVPGAVVLLAGLNAEAGSEWLAVTLMVWAAAAGIDALCCYGGQSQGEAESELTDERDLERR